MTTLNITTLAQVQLSQVIEQLNDYDTEALINIYNQYADAMSYERVYVNDEVTLNDLYQDASDALRAAFYGDYNHSHNYLTLNGYANLESFEYASDENSPIDVEELAQWIVDNELFDDFDIEVTTLDDILTSIEDNITDDENMLNKLIIYSNIELECYQFAANNGYTCYNEYSIGEIMIYLNNLDYNQLNDIIIHLGINYE